MPFSSNATGFPSPADDHLETYLDLNRHLIVHPSTTFFMRFQGAAMLQAGIRHGDLLIVDRSISPTDGRVVVAAIDDELAVRRLQVRGDRIYLLSENPNYKKILISEDNELQIWGVVSYVIHCLGRLQ